MAKNYLRTQSPQGFGKLSPPSSSSSLYNRAYLGPRSNSRKTQHKKALHISKRPRPNNLALRMKPSKMSTPSSPSTLKRTRLSKDSTQPKKHRRLSSNPGKCSLFLNIGHQIDLLFSVISSRIRELQPSRCSSEPRMYPFFILLKTPY